MLKWSFLCLFVSLNVQLINAQQALVAKVDLGVSTLSGDGLGSHSSKFSDAVGLGYNFQPNKNFGIEPAVKYFSKGSALNDVDASLNYISFPLTLKYYPVECLYLHAGPEFGVLLSAKYDNYEGQFEQFKDEVSPADFGLNFGADFFVENTPLTIGFNGVIGINDVAEEYIIDAKNRAWMASFNYYFTKK